MALWSSLQVRIKTSWKNLLAFIKNDTDWNTTFEHAPGPYRYHQGETGKDSWAILTSGEEIRVGDRFLTHTFGPDELVEVVSVMQQSIRVQRPDGESVFFGNTINHRGVRSKCKYCICSEKSKVFQVLSAQRAAENLQRQQATVNDKS